MATKLIHCTVCGAEMAANAKACPQCGAKNKKPVYKKWWFWVLLVMLLGGIVGGNSNSDKQENNQSTETIQTEENAQESEAITYAHYDVTELFDALNDNALKAEEMFNGQYVEIEGYLGTIDSSGKYIGVGAGENNWDYLLAEVKCYIKSDEQKARIMEMSRNDRIVIRGKITDVGEIMGYSLNIDSIG